MTRVYHYTPGVNEAGAEGPFDTARAGIEQRPVVSTRRAMFDTIAAALSGPLGAGWVETAASTETNKVYTSPGESGREQLVVTLNYDASQGRIQFGCAPSVDAAGAAVGAINNSPTTYGHSFIQLGSSDMAFEFQILASLDFIWVFISRQSNQQAWSLFAGLLTRAACNEHVLTVGEGGALSGAQAFVPTTENPKEMGVSIGDAVTLLQNGSGITPQRENVLVTAVLPGGVRVKELSADYAAGSQLGDVPSPLFVGHRSNGRAEQLSLRSCYAFSSIGQPELAEADGPGCSGFFISWPTIGTDRESGTTGQGLGSDQSPEARSRRYLCPETVVRRRSGAASSIVGVLPGLFMFPGVASFFPHDNLLRTRTVEEPEDYTPVRFDGYSSYKSEHCALGPMPR